MNVFEPIQVVVYSLVSCLPASSIGQRRIRENFLENSFNVFVKNLVKIELDVKFVEYFVKFRENYVLGLERLRRLWVKNSWVNLSVPGLMTYTPMVLDPLQFPKSLFFS